MLKLQEVTVGPIVGETTARRTRIWARGDAHIVNNLPRRCFGAVRFRESAGNDWSGTSYFKMNPNFDMTGIAVLTGLTANTHYDYEVGYFFSDVEMSDVGARKLDWQDASKGKFRSASDDDTEARNLVIGSCRYLLKTFLGSFFDDRGDKTFRSILRQIYDGKVVHQLLMIGDQIYADDLNSFNADKNVDQFNRRYRDAFSQKYIRRLMAQVPTYMTLDDHEIEDNWPSKASGKDWKTLFPVAMHSYLSYQLSHSPNIRVSGKRLVGTPGHLWYDYSDGCTDVFVTDSRTERFPGSEAEEATIAKLDRRMLNDKQLRALKRWMNNGSGRVKIIVTSVPFFPDSKSGEGLDKWSGYQRQRKDILEHIEKNGIRKVVFLSGDVHASFSAELTSPNGVKIVSVVSSAFFWPYPHPSANHFRLRGEIDGGKAGKFILGNASSVVGDDNFTCLRVTPTQLRVEVFGRKGRQLGAAKVHRF